MEIRPVCPAFGVELVGIDLREEQSEAVRRAAAAALCEHHLVMVRGQDLSLEDQSCFATWFGPLRPPDIRFFPTLRDAILVSNVRGENGGGSAEFVPHQDYAWSPVLLPAICLYAEEVSTSGGETIFVDAESALRALSAATAARLTGLTAIHLGPPKDTTAAIERDGLAKETTVLAQPHRRTGANPENRDHHHWPVVLEHPLTGHPVLFVTDLQTYVIDDLDPDEGLALLEELVAHLQNPAFQYEHRWRVGDVIIWDNIALQHARRAFPATDRRTLRKLQIETSPAF
jgi:taurine dioxygenase